MSSSWRAGSPRSRTVCPRPVNQRETNLRRFYKYDNNGDYDEEDDDEELLDSALLSLRPKTFSLSDDEDGSGTFLSKKMLVMPLYSGIVRPPPTAFSTPVRLFLRMDDRCHR